MADNRELWRYRILMFAFLKLPFLLTVILLGAVVVIVGAISRRPNAFAWAMLASIVGFIPSCTGIMYVIDQFRYGQFDYAISTEAPEDGYLEFPPTARNLTVFRSAPGHQAKFEIETQDLKKWIDEMRAKRPELNQIDGGETWESEDSKIATRDSINASLLSEIARGRGELFEKHFAHTGWIFNTKTKEFFVTRSGRGGGYRIWHEPGTNTAIMNAYYW